MKDVIKYSKHILAKKIKVSKYKNLYNTKQIICIEESVMRDFYLE
jgi:hypothetical protein